MRAKKSICPPNKFGFGKKCVTWLYVLTIFTLFAALIICIIVYLDKYEMKKINQKYTNRIHINRLVDDNNSQCRKESNMNHHLANQGLHTYNVKNLNSGQLRSLMNSHFDDKTVNKFMRYRYLNENRQPMYDNELSPDDIQVESSCNRGGLNGNRDINININVPREPKRPNLNEISYPNYIHQKNHERIIHPLLPPERSYENTYGIPINIPTRGSSGGFQQV